MYSEPGNEAVSSSPGIPFYFPFFVHFARITYTMSDTTMPLTGPTKNGTFRQGTASTSFGKLAKVPPVMQATTAPIR